MAEPHESLEREIVELEALHFLLQRDFDRLRERGDLEADRRIDRTLARCRELVGQMRWKAGCVLPPVWNRPLVF